MTTRASILDRSVRWLVRGLVLVIALGLLPACSSEVKLQPGCPEPGQVQACQCDSGEFGFQVCQENRQWGACDCGGAGDMADIDEDAPDAGDDLEDAEPDIPEEVSPSELPSFASGVVAGGAAESTNYHLRFSLAAPLRADDATSEGYRLRFPMVIFGTGR